MLGPKSARQRQVQTAKLDLTYTVTALLDCDNQDHPITLTLRHGSNTQWDFANFLFFCVQEGRLRKGDYLVLDNATVHHGSESFEMINDVLKQAEIKLLFLPAYSPELNPIELCFGMVKNYLKYHRDEAGKFWLEIIKGFARITHEHAANFFTHCLKL